MINLKSAKGGVAIYVLVSMLILSITLMVAYVLVTNKQEMQLEIAEQIKASYEKDMDNIDMVYNRLIAER